MSGGIAYPARGLMGSWLTDELTERNYRFLGAEFGTHPIVRVLGALRSENRAHYYSQAGQPTYERAKKELLECFCPASASWRKTAIEQGLQIIRTAIAASVSMNG